MLFFVCWQIKVSQLMEWEGRDGNMFTGTPVEIDYDYSALDIPIRVNHCIGENIVVLNKKSWIFPIFILPKLYKSILPS